MTSSHTVRTRRRRLAATATAVLLAGAPLTASALEVSGTDPTPTERSDAISWSIVPATDDAPDGRISVRHELEPGERLTDAVALTNLGSEPASFAVYPGDGVVGTQGAFDVREAERAGTWIEVEGLDPDGSVLLDAGETRVLPLVVDVPDDALPGDHPAGVVAAVTQADDATTVTHRVGVRMHLRVAGEIEPQLVVTDVRTRWTPSWIPFAPGQLEVSYQVANAGNVRLGAASSAAGAGPAGMLPAEGRGTIEELLPGEVVEQQLVVGAWPSVLFDGALTLDARTVGEDVLVLPPSSSVEVRALTMTWTGLALLVGLLVVASLLIRRRLRRSSR